MYQRPIYLVKLKNKLLCIGFLFSLISSVNADDIHELYVKIKSKYPSLVSCAVPKEFENKEIKERLKANDVTVVRPDAKTMIKHSFIMDGCSAVIFESKEKNIFYIGIGGGIAGHISRLFGPFRVDGSDL